MGFVMQQVAAVHGTTDESHDGVSVRNLPADSKVLRYPRRKNFLAFVDGVITFITWHYLIWGIWSAGFLLFLFLFNYISAYFLVSWGVFYFTQLIFWQPQLKSGTPEKFASLMLMNPL